MKKITIVILCCCLFSLLIVGCSSKRNEKTNDPTEDSSIGTVETIPLPQHKTICFISSDTSHPYWATIEQGVKEAGKEQNATILVVNLKKETSLEEQLKQWKDKPIDAFLISGEHLDELETLQPTVPVVIIDASPSPQAQQFSYVADNPSAGKSAANHLFAQMEQANIPKDKPAEIIFYHSDYDDSQGVQRMAGFRSQWRKKSPTFWDVSEKTIKTTEEFSPAFFAEHPNLKAIFISSEVDLPIVAKHLKQIGKTDLLVIAFSDKQTREEIPMVTDFNIVILSQQPYQMGYDALATTAQLAREESLPVEHITYPILII